MKIQLHKLSDLIRDTLLLNDGSVATVVCIYFDDQSWKVRHFVVRVDGQDPGREVLIPPQVIRRLTEQSSSLTIGLTRRQLESAPSADSQLPISRHHELQISNQVDQPSLRSRTALDSARPWDFICFGWPPHQVQGLLFDPTIDPSRLIQPHQPRAIPAQPHLRSSQAVKGYRLHARNGQIGHLEDFILEEPDWNVRYLEIGTRNWLPGKHVLMPPTWIRDMNWALHQVLVDLDRETIRTAPPYDSCQAITHSDETALTEHYRAAAVGS
jgi:hypothetical protein